MVITATQWGLDSWKPSVVKVFHSCPDQPWIPPSLLHNGYQVFTWSKAAMAWHLPPNPIYWQGQASVQLHLYPPSVPLMACYGMTFTFIIGVPNNIWLFIICNMLGTDRSKVGVMNKLTYRQTTGTPFCEIWHFHGDDAQDSSLVNSFFSNLAIYQSPQHIKETCILAFFSHLHMQLGKGLLTEVTMPVPPSGSYTWKKINSCNTCILENQINTLQRNQSNSK